MREQFRWLINKYKPGCASHLHYIHIGKCGGSTVHYAIKESRIINDHFKVITKTHVQKPLYKRNTKYLFVVRNPIDRALSAFNWRYKLVVEDESQKLRFHGEYEILKKYETLDNLVLKLYNDDLINVEVEADFRKIHHLKEDINFYLAGCFKVIQPEQIFAVLCQKTLDDDIEKYLGVTNTNKIRENKIPKKSDKMLLSEKARHNLRNFLKDDYKCLHLLNQYFPLEQAKKQYLMQG